MEAAWYGSTEAQKHRSTEAQKHRSRPMEAGKQESTEAWKHGSMEAWIACMGAWVHESTSHLFGLIIKDHSPALKIETLI
jgi:hypothetical protein